MEDLKTFQEYRERMNEKLVESGHLGIKRFFHLDSQAYREGSLPVKTKEFMGLVASLVLRCDDCVTYHILRCLEEGATDDEMLDAFNVALVAGGSTMIPHLRRAKDRLEEIRASQHQRSQPQRAQPQPDR